MTNRVSFILFVVFLLPSIELIYAQNNAGPRRLVALFGNVSCLSRGKRSDLRNLGIQVKGANVKEKRIVSEVVTTIADIASGTQSKLLVGDLKVNFKKYLRQRTDGNCLPGNFGLTTPGAIDLARKCHPRSPQARVRFNGDTLRGSLIHEIGHYVGHRVIQGSSLYSSYSKAVSKKCDISDYSIKSLAGNRHRSRNEEFAEVWAAFIYATDLLEKKCKSAYLFMKNHVFETGNRNCESQK